MIPFIVWTAVACVFAIMGLVHWASKEVKGMVHDKVPEIPENNIVAYNHAVSILFWGFSALFEFLGFPLLFLEQNDSRYVVTILGTVFLIILLCVAYSQIENHYK